MVASSVSCEQGHCWIATLPRGADEIVGARLFENDTELGPADFEHQYIRVVGRGAFSLTGDRVYFSTSDNTNPLLNNRRYELRSQTRKLVIAPGSAANAQQPIGALVRSSTGRPLVKRRWLRSEEEVVEAIYGISMLNRPAIARLRQTARQSCGAILEIGSYVGGSTCAIADAVRGSRRKIISVEVGGEALNHPKMPSKDIIGDLKANLLHWDLEAQVVILDDWLHRSIIRIERALGGESVGLLFIDADGKIAEHMHLLVPYLSDRCLLAFDDFEDALKGAGVAGWVGRALENGSVEQIAVEVGGLWFGRLTGSPERLPVTPFARNQGKCFISVALAGRSLEPGFDAASVELFEDGRKLGPANATHADIRAVGAGRFSMWGADLYMSASGNDDPNANGKRYEAKIGDELVPLNFWRRFGRDLMPKNIVAPAGEPQQAPTVAVRVFNSPLFDDYAAIMSAPTSAMAPVNLQDRTESEIENAADYALRVGLVAQRIAAENDIPLEGAILEIGPGWDFGASMLLGERARRMIVADRFLAPWQTGFHPKVYRRLREKLARPSRLIDAVIERERYEGALETLAEPSNALTSLGDGEIDFVYSNAVLEHVHPLEEAVRELFRVTRSGGWGVHQIDLRYHRSYDCPLEHLLMTREEFDRLLARTHCEVGCQTRLKEAATLFETAGFRVERLDPNMTATDDYLQDFMPRLRAESHSPYRDWATEDLAAISGRVFVRKP